MGDVSALHANRQRRHLVAKLALRLGKELAGRGCIFGKSSLVVQLFPRGGDQLLLAFGNLGLVVTSAASTSATALLRLRELALERVDLDETDVRASLAVTISSGRI